MYNQSSPTDAAGRIADAFCHDRSSRDWRLARNAARMAIRTATAEIAQQLLTRAENLRLAGMAGQMTAADALMLDIELTDTAATVTRFTYTMAD